MKECPKTIFHVVHRNKLYSIILSVFCTYGILSIEKVWRFQSIFLDAYAANWKVTKAFFGVNKNAMVKIVEALWAYRLVEKDSNKNGCNKYQIAWLNKALRYFTVVYKKIRKIKSLRRKKKFSQISYMCNCAYICCHMLRRADISRALQIRAARE